MLNKATAPFLFAVLPMIGFAQEVELRSSDGFISVEGEVVGYNGTMLLVETSVGQVAVPASQVGCYGTFCTELIANNTFGLSANVLQGVFAAPENSAGTDETLPVSVAFADPAYADVFNNLVDTFAQSASVDELAELTALGLFNIEEAAQGAATTRDTGDAGQADIFVALQSLKETAAEQYPQPVDWARALQPEYQVLGAKAFAVIVEDDIGLPSITLPQLAGIYAGEIDNWAALGGPDKKILPLQTPGGSQARRDLVTAVMEPAGKAISSDVLTIADVAGIADSVPQLPGSISLVSLESTAQNTVLPVAGACGVAVAPTPFNIVSGDYPLAVPLVAGISEPANRPVLQGLLRSAANTDLQDWIAQFGYVNQRAIIQPEADKNMRLNSLLSADLTEAERRAAAQMFQDLFVAERLSPTLIGGATSGPEGAWNRSQFAQLSEILAGDAYAEREVLFVGFATSTEGSDLALSLSNAAAQAMQSAFTAYAPATVINNGLRLTSRGFGSLAPATCYDSQVSDRTAIRVEVWTR